MTRYILILVAFSLFSCHKRRNTRTEFIITDFSKPTEIIYIGKHTSNFKFVYGVEGKISGGKIYVLDAIPYKEGDSLENRGRVYAYTDTVKFRKQPSSFGKGSQMRITVVPQSKVVGQVKIFFNENSILVNNEERNLFNSHL